MGTSYSPNIVKDGLVFYVDPMNSRSWTGPDSSTINSLKGNNTGSIFNDTSGSFGVNTSFDFDGTDDHINTNFIPSDSITTSVTLAGWVRINVLSRYSVSTIVGIEGLNGGGSSSNLALMIYKFSHNSGDFRYYFGMGSQAGFGPDIGTLTGNNYYLNEWRYFAITYPTSGTGNKYYNNGVLDATDTFSNVLDGRVPSNGGVAIGARNKPASSIVQFNLDGQIGPVQIYNRELSAAEVKQNYNAMKARFK